MTTTSSTAQDPRTILQERLTEDLVGPSHEGDGIAERPSDRYVTGILFPQGAEIPGDENDGNLGAQGMDDDDDADDSPPPITGGLRPSSCGLSFALTMDGPPALLIKVTCARYTRYFIDPATNQPSTHPEHATRPNARWRRTPLVAAVRHTLAVDSEPEKLPLSRHGIDGLELYLRSSAAPHCTIVTAALVNRQTDPRDDRVAAEEHTFFQVAMTIFPVAPVRLTARPAKPPGNDRDARVSALIYRNVQEMAVGHTCSASWGPNDAAVEWVSTEWLPSAVVRRTRPEGDDTFNALRSDPTLKPLSATWLAATATDAELIAGLRLLVTAYSSWLDQQGARVGSLPIDLQSYATENLADCRTAAARMMAAVDLLADDGVARRAWRLAAGAMNLQFGWAKGGELQWHPFQLGFQLLVLPSLVDRASPDRSIMDLLWFPTGGGKTEAYLALTAFVLFYRRLHETGGTGAGTAVLMRYTLRLLTVQQFQRATILILACEAIRRGHEQVTAEPTPALGQQPFSIGLWVGGGATPNRFEDAEKALRDGGASTPRQLRLCPRCKWRLHYKAERSRSAIEVRCSNAECYFAERTQPMPIWVVDTDIYRERPSLLIATLDKFAQIVRKPETRVLFGLGTPHAPPDLIIQDELHLISGPLGSLAGLYEVAIDRLCSRPAGNDLRRPKIIGSTATIRRAAEQVDKLFARDAFQFPPPVIDATNSGFGLEDTDNPGRVYVGLSTAGRSAKFTLQATYASLLQAATDARIPDRPSRSNPRDRFWTLTGYFNSLRELGGAVTLVMDDVLKSIRSYARRRPGESHRSLTPPVELTSRVPSSEIPPTLERLEKQVGDPDCVDVLLASNMISVGVDVSRLGLMVVSAQPKTLAEYIQATSRVGRHNPGLVVVVYNHPRVRDRSFFETFPTWHRALYRAVEATSVTPFASRARDRAMHAVVVALARHLVPGLLESPALDSATADVVRELLRVITDRVARTDHEELPGSRQFIERFVQDWERLVAEGATEYWGKDHLRSLLVGAEDAVALEEHGEQVNAWATPNSMREVEPSALFRLWHPATGTRSRRRRSDADE